jgi:adenylate cyclase class 2
MFEVEAKIRVQSLAAVRARLAELGAEDCGATRERDVYFNAPDRDFGKTDEALRVRYSAQEQARLTYKGPKEKGYGAKARTELSVAVDHGAAMEEILGKLGYVPVAEVNKKRHYFRLPGASIALDAVVGLGAFVEVEAAPELTPADAIAAVDRTVKTLGIPGDYITLSYLEMLLSKQATQ